MAELITTARPYAQAAFGFAKENNQLNQWFELLNNLALLANDEAMAKLIANPSISSEDKISVFTGILGADVTAHAKNLLTAMAEHGRLGVLGHVALLFGQLKTAEDKRVKAFVVSALEPTVEQKSKLSAALNSKFNAQVDIEYQVDQALISGLRIKVGDWVVDNTAHTQLQKLRAAIAN
ncbi:F0F1 ATP synthase subunit delta [Thiomicrospira sp. R3]|uniref:F0F1 ATP synthase subunit delta n=1 Tax=Thiomicrospira sp. R3 TaxID=3035472 RepID=UPI00259B5D7F|nr:F0F1 ATP synthase subunit delta [Thiomicrospira sp. R3]WFE69421.1 F0F1 ATP synthase subunit delta [Thiomicrospira sp. R3]